MNNGTILTGTDLTKRYDDLEVVKRVSLSIEDGEFVCITGKSGSGKTTLLSLLSGLERPTSGQVKLDGCDVTGSTEDELALFRRENLGFIFQSFNLIAVLNVYENIEFPLLLQRSPSKREREQAVRRVIEEVGLADRIHNKPSELSGGQRQRVAIARALVTRPLIVLADEPTANLDSETGHRIVDLMRQINETEKTTFIFSTHDSHIMEHARRVVSIRDGRFTGEELKG